MDPSVAPQVASWCHKSVQFRVYQPTEHAGRIRLRGAHLRKVRAPSKRCPSLGVLCINLQTAPPLCPRTQRDPPCPPPAPRCTQLQPAFSIPQGRAQEAKRALQAWSAMEPEPAQLTPGKLPWAGVIHTGCDFRNFTCTPPFRQPRQEGATKQTVRGRS